VALSGGLDSRLLLACLPDPARAFAFCCYDEPNRELATAERIARSRGVRFLPLQRSPDYYGENAEAGVRISGGMGTIANNHFLGFLDRLHAEGMQTLLTGCYCDYLFKGLPLNRRHHWLTGRERLAPFAHEFYFDRWLSPTSLAARVRERWENHFPADLRLQDTPARVFNLEVRRTFPLCYEGDNQQRLVPQRLTGWSPPVTDRQVLEVYCRIPSRMKLNRSLFLKTSRLLLADSPLLHIPDANTGAPLNAAPLRECLSSNWLRLQRKLASRRRSLGSDGSWPDWEYYLTHSPRMAELWRRPQPDAFDFFRKVMGWKTVPPEPRDFQNGRTFLFVSLLTLKIWWAQRTCSNA
jgi:asparagine synthase (glutamine-hydrolysing)